MDRLLRRGVPFLVGLLGVLVGLLLLHLWSDHVAGHVIVDFLNQHGEKIRTLP